MFLTFSPPIYLAQRDKYVKRVILTIISFLHLAFFIQLLSSFLPLIPFTLAICFSFLHVCSLFYPKNYPASFLFFPINVSVSTAPSAGQQTPCVQVCLLPGTTASWKFELCGRRGGSGEKWIQ